ncbi:MAG TPA: hypothetical protein VFB34_06245 [Chloroflexota bacterium]|nr:hypothetical protein [Chloroflexota bacterium]
MSDSAEIDETSARATPETDESSAPPVSPAGGAREAKSGVSRLGFLTRASMGAAAIGVMGSMPALAGVGAAEPAEVDTSSLSEETLTSPLVAHVGDVASGEVTVMSGLKELTVRDPQLVVRLLRALQP